MSAHFSLIPPPPPPNTELGARATNKKYVSRRIFTDKENISNSFSGSNFRGPFKICDVMGGKRQLTQLDDNAGWLVLIE